MKSKGRPPPSPEKPPCGPNGRRLFPIAEELLERAGNGKLNMYARCTIKTMWAGRYNVIDIVRRFALTKCPVSEKAVRHIIRMEGLEDAARSSSKKPNEGP